MRNSKQGYKHWDHSTGTISKTVTMKSAMSAFAFRPGSVVMLMSVAAGVLIACRVIAFTGVCLITLLSILVLFGFCQAGGSIRSRIAYFYILLYPLTIFIFLRSESIDRHNRNYCQEMIGSIIDVQGEVVSVPDLNEAENDWSSVKLRLENGCLIDLSGKIGKLEYGDMINAKVKIELPAKETNPGGFSMRSLLKSEGIYAAGRVVLAQDLRILKRGNIWHKIRAATAAKSAIRRTIRSFLDQEQADLLLAIFIGDDSQLDPAVKISFRRSGLAHLTSVSGSHISFFLMPISLLAGLMKLGKRTAAFVQISLLLMYGTITGWNTGAVRAVFMLCILLVLKASDRSFDAVNSLGIVCGCMIFHDVYIVRQVGFWLSAGAAAALIIFAGPCADWFRTVILERTRILLPDALVHSLCAVVLLQIVMIPITARLTGEVFWFSWLYNMPAIFLVSIICMLSVFTIPVLMILTYAVGDRLMIVIDIIEAAVAAALESPLRTLLWLAKAGSDDRARSSTSDFNLLIFIGGALLAAALWLRFIQPRKFCFGKLPLWAGLILLITGVVFLRIGRFKCPDWTSYFLDVGQGDSMLLVNRKNSKAILVDGGPENSGYYDIEPAMRELGVNMIDLAIVTHGHADHISGVIELAELGLIEEIAVSQISVKAVDAFYQQDDFLSKYTSDSNEEQDMTKILISICSDLSIPVQYLKKHDTITLPGDASMNVISPDSDADLASVREDQNEASIIIEFLCGSFRTLLLADLAEKQERELMTVWMQADLIKVAHHGSKMTTGEQFLERVQPRHAIISSGPNFYGHPSPQVINRLEAANCVIWRTDTNGCVIVEYSNGEARIKDYGR